MSSQEQAPSANTELDSLAAEAAAVDLHVAPPSLTTGAPAAPGQPEAPAVDRAGEAAMLLGLARPLLSMTIPGLKDAPDQEWAALQDPIAGLLDYYAVDVGKWLNNPWAKLGAAAIPLAMRGVMAWNAEEEKPAQIGAPVEKISAQAEMMTQPEFAPRG